MYRKKDLERYTPKWGIAKVTGIGAVGTASCVRYIKLDTQTDCQTLLI